MQLKSEVIGYWFDRDLRDLLQATTDTFIRSAYNVDRGYLVSTPLLELMQSLQ